jgi:hypothetical protein
MKKQFQAAGKVQNELYEIFNPLEHIKAATESFDVHVPGSGGTCFEVHVPAFFDMWLLVTSVAIVVCFTGLVIS